LGSKTGNCIEPYRVAFKAAYVHNKTSDKVTDCAKKMNGQMRAADRNVRTVEPPHHPVLASVRGIGGLEPQSSRGAAYMRNTARIIRRESSEEKRDFGKGEKFKMKRRCNSIIIEDDDDIRLLEVRVLSVVLQCMATYYV